MIFSKKHLILVWGRTFVWYCGHHLTRGLEEYYYGVHGYILSWTLLSCRLRVKGANLLLQGVMHDECHVFTHQILP
jgi:hypothetical protein